MSNIVQNNNGTLKFKVNTNNFKIHYKVTNIKEGYYPHLGVTLREGIILLYKHPQKNFWACIDAYHNGNIAYVKMGHMLPDDITYEVLLYTPLLSDMDELIIETDDEHHIEYIKENNNRKILLCGGPTSFGIGCTAVSLMFSNILARKLDSTITNISFDDDNYLKKVQEYIIHENLGKYDIGIIELNQITQETSEYIKVIINTLKTSCDTLIGWYDNKNVKGNIEELLKDEIDNNIIILKDITYIFDNENKDICTYNDTYINDSGNILIFKELFSTICEVTKWNI